MDGATTHYMDCREEEVVTILEATQVNSGHKFMAFPGETPAGLAELVSGLAGT